ncbi:carotenoid oxygenase family protein [Bordetella bronchialis]|uniref:carotenoid oxygenase family protein n=1 Tax=Bordetella bronchialis TaxID=463025 RepID=UPI0009F56C93|nr:carotenoid oxygenase family protein [Bordetella bronchialis]
MIHPTFSRRAILALGLGILGSRGLHVMPSHAAPAVPDHGPAGAPPWRSDNPACRGAFEPVFDERDDADLPVRGAIPAGLAGVFMRNGPNPYFEPDARYAYPFDGTGMIHAITLRDGRARYRNRWIRTAELRAEIQAGHRIYNSTFSPPPQANLANTNIVYHGGRYLALYEGDMPYEVDGDIATRGVFDYQGKLAGRMSAHPKIDPRTGELLAVSYDLLDGKLTYLRADASGRLDRSLTFRAPWAAMVHDIALTERHVVVLLCPLVFDWSRHGIPAQWEPDRGTRVALIPRDAERAEEIRWIEAAPFFNWHTVNAYEENGRIEIVLPWYDSYSLTAKPDRLELHRLAIDIRTGRVGDETIDAQVCEFGRVNDAYLGRKARYGYVGLRTPRPGEAFQPGAFEAIARYDLQTGERTVHRFGPGMTICEPLFAADPDGAGEADGYILTFVHDAASRAGQFVILDARRLDAGPVAVVELPRRVPAGLHGSWIPAARA